ncbi:MAG: ATP-binding protein [Pelagimonas sp.]
MLNSPMKKSILFVAAAGLLIFGIWLVTFRVLEADYDARVEAGSERAQEMAVFFERDTRKILMTADAYVQEARRLYELSGDVRDVEDFVSKALPQNDMISHLTVIGADGVPLLVSGHKLKTGVTAADREYFKFQQQSTGDEVYISLPHLGRNSGKLTVRLVRRITGPDGAFGGVVFAAVNEDQFTAFYKTLNLGDKSSATVVGLDKKLRARSSYGRLGPGQDISGSRIWKELGQSEIGLYRQLSVVDDVQRWYAYHSVEEYPLVVAMGLAEDDLITGAQSFAKPIYAIAGLTTFAVCLMTGMLCLGTFVRQALVNEISERREVEAGLEAANTDLLQFSYSASHDLKAPLSTISGLVDFCLEDLEDGEYGELEKHLKMALAVSNRSAKKVESLLRIARIGEDEITESQFDLRSLLDNIWQDLTADMGERCQLKLDLAHQDPIVAPVAILHAIIENLISNAIKYADPEKDQTLVHISSDVDGDRFVIKVSDNGVGIAQSDQSEVFKMFKRIDDRGGDGLGLALVRKHLERLGGDISLESTLGQGTTFVIYLSGVKEAQA